MTQPGGGHRPTTPGPRLVRARSASRQVVALDEEQRRVCEHERGPLLVLAGPGTGKTTALVELVARRVEQGQIRPDEALILSFSRRAALDLRVRVSARLGVTTTEPVARTIHSYAFGLLRREAARTGEPAPRLLGAAEHDVLITELIQGDLERRGPAAWPEHLRPALRTRGFAEELLDLIARTHEMGLGPADLHRLGREHGQPGWTGAAALMHQYHQVTALRPGSPALDPASLVSAAVAVLSRDDALLGAERAAHRLVLLDEAQDLDPMQEELVYALAGDGADLVAVGDPDQSIYGFRGSDPTFLRRFPERFRTTAGEAAPVVALRRSYRAGHRLLRTSRGLAERLGGPVGHRHLEAAESAAPGSASVTVLGSAANEARHVAAALRRAHLVEAVPWQRMAVLARSADQLGPMCRRLEAAGVPVRRRSHEVALVGLPAARALLDMLRCAWRPEAITAHVVVDLLQGPLLGVDPVAVRRWRRAARSASPDQSSDDLLVRGLLAAMNQEMDTEVSRPVTGIGWERPDALWPRSDVDTALRQLGIVLGRANRGVAAGADPEEALEELWRAVGCASQWRSDVLSDSSRASAADAHLDAVSALFDVAETLVDSLPGVGVGAFLAAVDRRVVPARDAGTDRPDTAAVSVMTAHASKGLEFDVVAVTGVQEGVWPSAGTTGRGLLAADRLRPAVMEGQVREVEVRTAALAEERRLLYVAMTRASRELLVTAVRDSESAPSSFVSEVVRSLAGQHQPEGAEHEQGEPVGPTELEVQEPARHVSLPSLVAELRHCLVDGDLAAAEASAEQREAAAAVLARLAAAGVAGADPAHWYGLAEVSTTRPMHDRGAEPVPVSPSQIGEATRCALRWFLESSGGRVDTTATGTGSLLHDLAEAVAIDELAPEELVDEVARRWPAISTSSGWIDRRGRERAQDMARRLARWLAANPRTLVAAELGFEVEVDGARVAGRVDRLERDESGRLVVVDLKTGATSPTGEEVGRHPQLATYQLAVQAGAFDEAADTGGAELVQLGQGRADPRVQQQAPLADGEPWARELLVEATTVMAGSAFAARAGQHCRICPVQMVCPAQPVGRGVVA